MESHEMQARHNGDTLVAKFCNLDSGFKNILDIQAAKKPTYHNVFRNEKRSTPLALSPRA